LLSDCGTNLKGADVDLQKLLSSATAESRRLSQLLAQDEIQWKFNPPSALILEENGKLELNL